MEVLAQLKKACEAGDAAALKAVLKANPELDIDALEDEGEMASPLLNLAAESGFCDCVKVLIDLGNVAVDSLGEFGTTALFDACYFDNRVVAEALVERGARAGFEDADGSTPLYAAAFQGNAACLDLMLRHKVTMYYHRGKDGLTPLHAAVLGGSKECVVRLLEAGHPIDALDAEKQTPLLAASNGGPCGSNGKKECLLELVKAGADVKAADALGRNAMQLLLLQGIGCPTCTCECAERLLERHASVLHPDAFGKTAAQHLGDMKPAPKLYSLLKRAIKRETLRNKLQRAEEPEERVDAGWLAEQEAQAAEAASALLLAEEAEKAAEAQRKDKAKRKRRSAKQRKAQGQGKGEGGSQGGEEEQEAADRERDSPSPPLPDPEPPALVADQPSPPAPPPAANRQPGKGKEGKEGGGGAGLKDTVRPPAQRPPSLTPTPTPAPPPAAAAPLPAHSFASPAFSLLDYAAQLDGREEEEDGEGELVDGEVDLEIEAFRMKLEEGPQRPKITLNREAFNSLREGLKLK